MISLYLTGYDSFKIISSLTVEFQSKTIENYIQFYDKHPTYHFNGCDGSVSCEIAVFNNQKTPELGTITSISVYVTQIDSSSEPNPDLISFVGKITGKWMINSIALNANLNDYATYSVSLVSVEDKKFTLA